MPLVAGYLLTTDECDKLMSFEHILNNLRLQVPRTSHICIKSRSVVLIKKSLARCCHCWCVYTVLTYRLSIYTGYMPTAGRSANSYVMLTGRRGDTGHRRLLHPLSAHGTTSAMDSVCHSVVSAICVSDCH